MATTTLRRRKSRAYGIGIATVNGLGLFTDGAGTAYAALYADGTYQADLASSGSVDLDVERYFAPVLHAQRYLLVPYVDEVLVWDLETNDVATASASSGYLIFGLGAIGDTVYWCEWEEVEHGPPYRVTARLRSAGFGLATPATVVSIDAQAPAGISADWNTLFSSENFGFALTPTAMLVDRGWVDQAGENSGIVRVRLPLSGGATQDDIAEASQATGIPQGDGAVLPNRIGALLGEPLLFMEDAVDAELEARFGSGGDWDMDNPVNAALSSDAATAAVFGFHEDDPVLVKAPAESPGASPSARLELAEHPEHGLPLNFYLYTPS